jgi:hypothetical protein
VSIFSRTPPILAAFERTDKQLVRAGFPATSPWWRAELDRFVRAGRRRWVIRAGRRAGKSSTLCRVAVVHTLFGAWSVPLGDTAIVAFVSVSRDESASRLRTIAENLRALGVPFEQRDGELELTGARRVVFRTFACTTTAVVGFTAIAVFADEMAKWEARDAMANPAADVMASLRPTMATQTAAFEVAVSSPWGSDDYHAQLFDAGDGAHQCVSFAPTWVANPTISEERTHELEPDPRTWAREYAAEPGSTVSPAFDPDDVAGCYRPYAGTRARAFVAADPSSLRGDAFAWISGHIGPRGEVIVTTVDAVDAQALRGMPLEAEPGTEGGPNRPMALSHIVDRISALAQRIGAPVVYSDQREEAALGAMFAVRRVPLRPFAWTDTSKDEAVQRLRRMMRERAIYLPDHTQLRRELTSMRARLVPSGRIKYETNGLDYASCLITLAHAIVAGALPSHKPLHYIERYEQERVGFTSPRSGFAPGGSRHDGGRSWR